MAKIDVELVYDSDCPNVEVARRNIRQGLADGPEYELKEWDRSDPNSPPYAALYGSPTVLVDGIDVSGADSETDAKSCRVYQDKSGQLHGAPTPEMIRSAVASHSGKNRGVIFAGFAGIASTLGMASIPALTCPACWPAYIGLLGAAGIGYFDFTPYLVPSIVVSVVVALAAIGYQSYNTKSLSILVLGMAGAMLVLGGRLWLLSDRVVADHNATVAEAR